MGDTIFYTISHKLISVYTKVRIFQEEVTKWVYSFIPYYIYSIDYISDDENTVKNIYKHRKMSEWINTSFCKDLSGYLRIKYWDIDRRQFTDIILHTKHIMKGLKSNDISILWAYSHEGIIKLLLDYIKKNKEIEILEMFINKKSIYKSHKFLIPSISVKENLTPSSLVAFYMPELFMKEDDIIFMYYNDILDEIEVKNNNYIS